MRLPADGVAAPGLVAGVMESSGSAAVQDPGMRLPADGCLPLGLLDRRSLAFYRLAAMELPSFKLEVMAMTMSSSRASWYGRW